MSRVLITGCAGFIGSHLTSRFLEQGSAVVGVDNLSRNGTAENLKLFSGRRNFEFFKTDIRDFPALADIFQKRGPFDLVIHEAAQVAVTTSVVNPREDFEINALGTFNVLEAARLHSPEALVEFASTNKVYGKMTDIEIIEQSDRYGYAPGFRGINESYPLDFYSPYGCSKGAADQYVRDYSRIYGLRTVVLRQSCIYGTRQFGIEDQGWVAWFIIASLLGRPITIYGDGKQVRDVLWIDDLVNAYVEFFKQADWVAGHVFNIGGGPGHTLSLRDLLGILRDEGILKKEPRFSDWRPGDQKVFICDVSEARKQTGWQPETSPREGVKKLLNWAAANREMLTRVINAG